MPRFLFSSSCSNYGAAATRSSTRPRRSTRSRAYGVSKVQAERDLLQLADDDFSPVLLRSATAYGVSPRLRCDIVLNNLTAWAVATGKVLIKSDGTPWRPIVHVEDISRAFLAALQAPREVVHAQAFNVARPDANYRIRELAEIVARDRARLRDRVRRRTRAPTPATTGSTRAKIARMLPSFQPHWTAREGARQLYEAFVEHGITLDDIEGWRFRRIGQIKRLLDRAELGPDLRWKQ